MFGASLPRRVALCALAAVLVILPAQPAQARSSATPEKAGVAKRGKRVARCGRKHARKAARKRAQRRRRCLGRIAAAKKDRTPPNVAFTAPAAGATVSGVLSGAACEASASDAHGVDRVEFSVDGTPLNVERVMPYNCVWDTSTVAAGSHVLTARAVDTTGRAATASVTVQVGAPAPAPAPSPSSDPAPGAAAIGMSASLRWLGQADIAATLDKLKAAGVQYVREDWHWNLIESMRGTYDWTRYDRLMRETALRGIGVIAIPNAPPGWATGSSITPPLSGDALTAFTTFVRRAIERYGSQGTFWSANPSLPKSPVVMWDIWNEPWGFWSWGPMAPDGGAYARMFRDVVAAVRAVDPAARFMADIETRAVGPSTLTSYMHAMFDAVPDLGRYMDMVSHHPYPDSTAPTTCTPNSPSKGVYEDWKATMFQFCRLKDVRAILDARGASATRIWVTEVGFTTAPSATRTVTETQQAQYVHDVFRLLRAWDVADGMLWFNYRDPGAPDPTDREDWFGLVRGDGSAKPAWSAFVEEAKAGL